MFNSNDKLVDLLKQKITVLEKLLEVYKSKNEAQEVLIDTLKELNAQKDDLLNRYRFVVSEALKEEETKND